MPGPGRTAARRPPTLPGARLVPPVIPGAAERPDLPANLFGPALRPADPPGGIFPEVYTLRRAAPTGLCGRGGGKLIIDIVHGLAVFRT